MTDDLEYSLEAQMGLISSIQQSEAEQIEKAWAAERAARLALAAQNDPRAARLEDLVLEQEKKEAAGSTEAQLAKLEEEMQEREVKRKAELAALKKVPPPPMPSGE